MNMLKSIFPIRDWLYIFQILEYDRERFLLWIVKNLKRRGLEKKNALQLTRKTAVVFMLSIILYSVNYFLLYTLILNSALTCSVKILLSLVLFLLTLQIYFIYIWLSALFLAPFETIIKHWFLARAKTKLAKHKTLLIIAITGSYGKTSVKNIVAALLEPEYSVLKTPQNYNTPLGIAQTILNSLTPKHQIFVVEMGAYQKGDIKKLCDFVHPTIGILTGISGQHLERFGSLKTIIETKSELIQALPDNGMILLNYDSEPVRTIAIPPHLKKITYSVENPSDFMAKDIRITKAGSSFSAGSHHFITQLLGAHAIVNCLPGLYIAREKEINWPILASTLSQIKPLPHRLELIDSNPNLTILDDAYSSNPEGFKAALSVLKECEGNRKILITPGIVELGASEKEIHMSLGELSATVCDVVILVGNSRRTRSFKEGLYKAGFADRDVRVVENIEAAQDVIKNIASTGDVLLFENDLPDQY